MGLDPEWRTAMAGRETNFRKKLLLLNETCGIITEVWNSCGIKLTDVLKVLYPLSADQETL